MHQLFQAELPSIEEEAAVSTVGDEDPTRWPKFLNLVATLVEEKVLRKDNRRSEVQGF
jgi:hypothetical protein